MLLCGSSTSQVVTVYTGLIRVTLFSTAWLGSCLAPCDTTVRQPETWRRWCGEIDPISSTTSVRDSAHDVEHRGAIT